MVLVIIVAIAVFLIVEGRSRPCSANTANFFTYTELVPERRSQPQVRHRGARLRHRAHARRIALIMAVPVALGIALFLSHYAPRRLATGLGFVIDLLAAVPSVVFGLWGRDYPGRPVAELSGLAAPLLRLDPDLRRRRPVRPVDPARLARAGDHDPADRHLAVPRGLPADARG